MPSKKANHLVRLKVGGLSGLDQPQIAIEHFQAILEENRISLGLARAALRQTAIQVDNPADLPGQIRRVWQRSEPQAVVVEIPTSFSSGLVDSVLSSVSGARRKPRVLIVVLNDLREFEESVVFKREIDRWDAVGVPLIVADLQSQGMAYHWRPRGKKSPLRLSSWRRVSQPAKITPADIETLLRVMVGHFATTDPDSRHFSACISARGLLETSPSPTT